MTSFIKMLPVLSLPDSASAETMLEHTLHEQRDVRQLSVKAKTSELEAAKELAMEK